MKILLEAVVEAVVEAIDSSTAISASGALPKASIGAMFKQCLNTIRTIRKVIIRFNRLGRNESGCDIGICNVLGSSESLLNNRRHEDKNDVYNETNNEKSTFQRVEMTIEEENDQ